MNLLANAKIPEQNVAEGLLILALLIFCVWSIGSSLLLIRRDRRETE